MLDHGDIRISNIFEAVGENLTDGKDNHKCPLCDRCVYMNKRRPTMNTIQSKSEEKRLGFYCPY